MRYSNAGLSNAACCCAIPPAISCRTTITGWPLPLDLLPQHTVDKIVSENMIDQKLWETWQDVRRETGAVRPVALERNASSFIAREAVCLVNQIVRRVQRRWGTFDAPIPVMPGSPLLGLT
jgi:hypothetical protein